MTVERHALSRGGAFALCAAAVAAAFASNLHASPTVTWVFMLARDLSLLAAGFILLTLGLRSVRRLGLSIRTAAYPLAGILVFSALIAAAVVAHGVIETSLQVSGERAPPQMLWHRDAVGVARFASLGAAAVSAIVGMCTPVRRTPAA